MMKYASPIAEQKQCLKAVRHGDHWCCIGNAPFCRRMLRLFLTSKSVLSTIKRKDMGNTS